MKTAKLMSIVLPILWLAVLGSAMQVIYARHNERVANAKLQMNLPQTRDVRIVRP
jgi:cell division protein FtsL